MPANAGFFLCRSLSTQLMFDDLRYADLDCEAYSWLQEQSSDYQRWAIEAFIKQLDDETLELNHLD